MVICRLFEVVSLYFVPEIILVICSYRTPASHSSLPSIDNFNELSEGM